MRYALLLAILLSTVPEAAAQLAPANQAGVAMGHLHYRVKDVNANVVFWLPNAGSPVRAYFTGGPSYSRIKFNFSDSGTDLSISDNNWGFNVGGGLDFALGALSTRLDVRYRRISSDDFFGSGESGTVQYIPITFGLTF